MWEVQEVGTAGPVCVAVLGGGCELWRRGTDHRPDGPCGP